MSDVANAGPIVTLGGDGVELEILPDVGARWHRLRVDGHDLLRTPDDLHRHLDDPWFWGSYPMAPWCNRVAPGRLALAGRELELPVNFPDGTAIHGQVSRAAWRQVDDGAFRIRAGGDGWPWPYEVEQLVEPGDGRLALTLRLTNLAEDPMPGGVGIHPWFRKPVEVAIRATRVHPSNEASEPEPIPVAGPLDRRRLEPMPDDLDGTWVDVEEPPIELAWPAAGLRAMVTFEAPSRFVTAASPAAIDAVAVEAQTHAPGGIRRLLNGEPGALAMVPPGGALELRVQFAFEPLTVQQAKPDRA